MGILMVEQLRHGILKLVEQLLMVLQLVVLVLLGEERVELVVLLLV